MTDELDAANANLAAAEMMLSGSTDVLARYANQIRTLEALIENADGTTDEEQRTGESDLRTELDRAYTLIDRLQRALTDEQDADTTSPSNPLRDDF